MAQLEKNDMVWSGIKAGGLGRCVQISRDWARPARGLGRTNKSSKPRFIPGSLLPRLEYLHFGRGQVKDRMGQLEGRGGWWVGRGMMYDLRMTRGSEGSGKISPGCRKGDGESAETGS